jgi:hypothetical protein
MVGMGRKECRVSVPVLLPVQEENQRVPDLV